MNNLGLTSRFALLGIHLAICCLLFGLLLIPAKPSPVPAHHALAMTPPAAEWVASLEENNHHTATDYMADEMREISKTPCFTVTVDPTVPGADEDYRSDLFGPVHLTNQEMLAGELEAALLQDFTDKIWQMSGDCIEGTFVVSFPVNEAGQIGETMLVHHPRGAAQTAALSVLRVLVNMRDDGYVWADIDGTTQAGEIRVPLRFRIG